ncbi:MAG TPA: hypothetical protein VJG90_03615 [Candidatus Nanoarchaeia archaeon]|nr:hypothetical protein [Candidatus Nanoarchaeia archaeon]
MTRIVTDGVEFTKRTVNMLKKAREEQNQPQTFTAEEIRNARLPTPADVWRTWSPDNKQMYR